MLRDLLEQPAYFAGLCLLLGLLVGSFLNVVIHRLPQMLRRDWLAQCAELTGGDAQQEDFRKHGSLSLARPRSRCPKCAQPIAARDNIPILSWLLLRGRCRACGQPISIRYPLVEAVSGALSAYAAWHFGFGIAGLGALVLIWAMIALTFIDFDTQLLPDDITMPLLWAGLAFNLGGTYTDLQSAVIGAMAGYLALWLVYWAFRLATGKEGMGYGDFKLLAAIGAWLGWQVLPLTLLLSSLVGAVVGMGLIVLARHGRDVPIPFGPYLAASGILGLFFGQPLTRAYLNLL